MHIARRALVVAVLSIITVGGLASPAGAIPYTEDAVWVGSATQSCSATCSITATSNTCQYVFAALGSPVVNVGSCSVTLVATVFPLVGCVGSGFGTLYYSSPSASISVPVTLLATPASIAFVGQTSFGVSTAVTSGTISPGCLPPTSVFAGTLVIGGN